MMNIAEEPTQVDLTPALRTWAKRKNIRPVDFSKAMGWGYSHSWAVLKGKERFALEAYGKFITAYGLLELQEIYRIARVDPKGISENIRPE